MTRTEAMLTDALEALTETVRDHELRPLPEPARKRSRAPGLVVAIGAAVSVLAVVAGLLVAGQTAGKLAGKPAKPFADTGTAAHPPPYYVTASQNNALVVRSTATGSLTDTTRSLSGGFWTLAASANGRYFVAVSAPPQTAGLNIMVYRFSLTAAGKVTGLMPVSAVYVKPSPCFNLAYNAPRGRSRCLPQLPWLSSVSAAISDDGSQIAIAGLRNSAPTITPTNRPYILLVEKVATHQVRSWQFPAAIATRRLIGSVSWAANGRSVQFLADRCLPGRTVFDRCLGDAAHADPVQADEWSLAVPPAGVLRPTGPQLQLPDAAVQALRGSTGLTALTLEGGHVAFWQIAGRPVLERMLYSARIAAFCRCSGASWQLYLGSNFSPLISVDASGKYVLFVGSPPDGVTAGWFANGKLHDLPGAGAANSSAAW